MFCKYSLFGYRSNPLCLPSVFITRHRHFQWYFPKINRSSKGYNIISIENLLPFKTFTDEELLSIFEMPTFGFDALLFIIEFCSFKISDNRNIFADKLQVYFVTIFCCVVSMLFYHKLWVFLNYVYNYWRKVLRSFLIVG